MLQRHLLLVAVFGLLLTIQPSACRGEIPNRSEAQLGEDASHIVAGKIARTYERTKKTSDNFEHTYGVAEIAADDVKKGEDIAPGDRVFVRYWRKRWIGRGNPAPDHFGHRNVPAEGDSVVVYVKGDRKQGFDVLSPNGFFSDYSFEVARRASATTAIDPQTENRHTIDTGGDVAATMADSDG